MICAKEKQSFSCKRKTDKKIKLIKKKKLCQIFTPQKNHKKNKKKQRHKKMFLQN
jgi:hypothetical protein